MNGVFNHMAHAAELEQLFSGRFKQFQIIPVPLDNQGIVKIGGGDQGSFEIDGTGVLVLGSYVTRDLNVLSSKVGVPIYLRFNHTDNPFLPIGLPDSTQTTVQPFPSSMALTIGKLWAFVPAASINAGQVIYLLLVKGVSISGAASLSAAAGIATYSTPTQANPWAPATVNNPSGGSKSSGG